MSIVHPASESGDDLPIPYLQKLLDRLVHRPPPSWNDENRNNLHFAVRSRFEKLGVELPPTILNILQLSELMAGNNQLIRLLSDTGPRGTSNLDECKEMLAHIEPRDSTFTHVANALLFMVFSQGVDDSSEDFDASVFVAGLREHRAGKRLDWQDVVGALDRPGLVINKNQFLTIYNALLPLAQEYENFDIQLLWGGAWENLDTQLSFVVAFLLCSPTELDASTIPRLRSSYQLEQFEDASDDVKDFAAEAVKYPFVSLDAAKSLFGMIFQSQESYKEANYLRIPETIINPHTHLFVLAIAAVPQPWNTLQNQAFNQLFNPFLRKLLSAQTTSFVMHGLWKRDHLWLIYRFIAIYENNVMDLEYIYQHAQEHSWIPTLTSIANDFGVDVAALAHKHGQLNLQEYLESSYRQLPQVFPNGLARILESKARNELALQKKSELATPAISLSLSTVSEFLDFLDSTLTEETQLQLLKMCISAYPRLINYGEGFDAVLDANCQDGHQLPEEADQIMQENFRKLYNNEIKVRDMIEDLQRFKQSEDGAQQDMFASLIKHGLFDEYSCFSEYPIEALSHTAVLFGGVISYKLINRWALQLAMAMVLDAVHTSHSRDDKMYKFGLQALKQFQGRLHEWPQYCERLLRIDLLKTTDIWTIAEEVLQTKTGKADEGDAPGSPGVLLNGAETYAEHTSPPFTCILPDPANHDDHDVPSEDTQDKVLFALNNVSVANLEEKQMQLRVVLQERYYSWFAEYLVDQRAKMQANFQGLYLTLLELFLSEDLWEDVLRETYVSIARLLNSEATLTSAPEKTHLKNLGAWLGSLTLARDQPIRLRNFSFRDFLIQAHATQRLGIAIPFTAKVLAEATKGELFQLPNPWTVEILRILLELYQFAELRINHKFEIETLCTTLKFDMKKYEPSKVIRESMQLATTLEDEFDDNIAIQESMEPFPNMNLLSSQPRVSRGSFSPATLAENLPDVSQRLVYPPHSSNVVSNDQLRQIFSSAAQQAISEIIFPVVERSVTIAAIAAAQLVVKDFATEPDENKFRNAAHQVVKQLSGCLAMVTCREPLRMSMSNHVRAISRNYHDNIPEGVILMFVNDNLDTVCRVIEEAAEKHSVAEIENQIREATSMRQVHASSNADRAFNWPPSSNYAFVIPEPYKLSPGGVRPEQLTIYENFGQSGSNHLLAGHDTRQQIQEALHDQFSAVSNLQSQADGPNNIRQAPTQRLIQPPSSSPAVPAQLNGYGEHPTIQDRAESVFVELLRESRDCNEERLAPAMNKQPRLREAYERVVDLLTIAGSQRDNVALFIANQVPGALFQEAESRLEVEVLVQLLQDLCRYSATAARQIIIWLASLEDELLNPAVTVSLVSVRLMEIQRVDSVLAKSLQNNKLPAVQCLAELVEYLLLSDHPLAIRSNLASSFEALVQWIQKEPELEAGMAIIEKLQLAEPTLAVSGEHSTEDEISHVFEEWVQLHRPEVADKLVAAFVRQLHSGGMLQSPEKLKMFLQTCFEISVVENEREPSGLYEITIEQSYVHIDALASLVVALTVYQSNHSGDGEAHLDRVHFFESILSISILYQCEHWRIRGEEANQKVFFRFYSTLLSEIQATAAPNIEHADDMYLALSRAFLAMQPSYLPGFVFGWLGLVSHRVFIAAMMTMSNEVSTDRFFELLHIVFDIAGKLSDVVHGPEESDLAIVAREFYRGALRLLVVIAHDFQDFMVQNHFRLCNSIPEESPQLTNLVLSAMPSSGLEFPHPLTRDVKLEHIDGMLESPKIRNDFEVLLKEAKLLPALTNILNSFEPSPVTISKFYTTLRTIEPPNKKRISVESHRRALMHAVVLYTCVHALQSQNDENETYNKSGTHAQVLRTLSKVLDIEDRATFVEAIINQLRFPNTHTLFFLHATVDLFSMGPTLSNDNADDDGEESESVMELIVRTILARLSINRPYPWGAIVALGEVFRSSEPAFGELSFIKNNPEVRPNDCIYTIVS